MCIGLHMWHDMIVVMIMIMVLKVRGVCAGGIKGSITNKRQASIRRRVGPVPAWGRGM